MSPVAWTDKQLDVARSVAGKPAIPPTPRKKNVFSFTYPQAFGHWKPQHCSNSLLLAAFHAKPKYLKI
ncbi:hypothetical protein [uncultured Roseobacter sp.]|uniref:hypothetical protein n=1 Tax=uncultured Roseobacter sp. TaxID=114847 RepID=UPI002627315A|nr:hypothetical protein [uncultured Roseobacter sp.]